MQLRTVASSWPCPARVPPRRAFTPPSSEALRVSDHSRPTRLARDRRRTWRPALRRAPGHRRRPAAAAHARPVALDHPRPTTGPSPAPWPTGTPIPRVSPTPPSPTPAHGAYHPCPTADATSTPARRNYVCTVADHRRDARHRHGRDGSPAAGLNRLVNERRPAAHRHVRWRLGPLIDVLGANGGTVTGGAVNVTVGRLVVTATLRRADGTTITQTAPSISTSPRSRPIPGSFESDRQAPGLLVPLARAVTLSVGRRRSRSSSRRPAAARDRTRLPHRQRPGLRDVRGPVRRRTHRLLADRDGRRPRPCADPDPGADESADARPDADQHADAAADAARPGHPDGARHHRVRLADERVLPLSGTLSSIDRVPFGSFSGDLALNPVTARLKVVRFDPDHGQRELRTDRTAERHRSTTPIGSTAR